MSKIVVGNTLSEALRAIDTNPSLKRLLMDLERQQSLIRAAAGPIAELSAAGVFDFISPLRQELERTRRLMEGFEAQFRLPEIAEATRLMAELQRGSAAEALERYHQQTSTLRQAMEQMQSAWLHSQERFRSVSAFARLQGIGQSLTNMPTFDVTLTKALRLDLGDWRDRISWPNSVLEDLTERSAYYRGLGFDSALTDFPPPALYESLDIAGVSRKPPSLVDEYGPPVPMPDDHEDEVRLQRTNMAHDWLLRLETQLRRFIDDRMTEKFGSDWPKRRLPKNMSEEWRDKESKAGSERAGEWPLICYADFTDYEVVICKRDNWREVFCIYFRQPESVRESFQRLYPIRNDTMHARPITQDDELLLYVETKRLVKVIYHRR